jgi:hypothetical protein
MFLFGSYLRLRLPISQLDLHFGQMANNCTKNVPMPITIAVLGAEGRRRK